MKKKKRKVYKPVGAVYYDVSHHKDQKGLGDFIDKKEKEEDARPDKDRKSGEEHKEVGEANQ